MCISYLRNEHEAECARGAEDDEYGYDDVGCVLVIPEYVLYRHPYHAHDHHIVHAHAYVFTVIQSGDVHCTRLPGQETTKQLQQKTHTALVRKLYIYLCLVKMLKLVKNKRIV